MAIMGSITEVSFSQLSYIHCMFPMYKFALYLSCILCSVFIMATRYVKFKIVVTWYTDVYNVYS